eukprot:gene26457-biopygen3584
MLIRYKAPNQHLQVVRFGIQTPIPISTPPEDFLLFLRCSCSRAVGTAEEKGNIFRGAENLLCGDSHKKCLFLIWIKKKSNPNDIKVVEESPSFGYNSSGLPAKHLAPKTTQNGYHNFVYWPEDAHCWTGDMEGCAGRGCRCRICDELMFVYLNFPSSAMTFLAGPS